jgi:hypothetical protein
MTIKRPIDRQREAGGSMRIGTEDDGAIKSMFPIGGVLHIIKERGIYVVKLADNIDPERTNPNIPNTQQRVLTYGSDSELVGLTLLTAKKLFNDKFLPKFFDPELALVLAFDSLKDLVVVHETATGYQMAEKNAVDNFTEQQRTRESLVVPAIGDVESRCKTFIQKADHACRAVLNIARLFYNNLSGFESLGKLSGDKYGKDDPFTQFLVSVVPLLTFIRETRNAIEHPNSHQKCTVTDFALGPDGTLVIPRIEVKYRSRQYPPESVREFMTRVNDELPKIFEMTIVYMCGKHVQSFAGIPIQVAELTENQRAEKYVRFSYVGIINGQVAPIST